MASVDAVPPLPSKNSFLHRNTLCTAKPWEFCIQEPQFSTTNFSSSFEIDGFFRICSTPCWRRSRNTDVKFTKSTVVLVQKIVARDRLSACSARDHTESGTSSWVDISGHLISWLPRRIKTSNGRYGHNHKAFRICPEPHFPDRHDYDAIDKIIYQQPKQCNSPCSQEHVLSVKRRVLHR